MYAPTYCLISIMTHPSEAVKTRSAILVCMKKGSISDGVVYHAGFPNAGEEQRFDSLSLDSMVFRHRASTYLWRLDGQGIAELGWQPGAIVVCDRALHPHEQDVVVAVADNEFVVRRWHNGHMVLLDGRPEQAQEVALWGVVTHTLTEYRSA